MIIDGKKIAQTLYDNLKKDIEKQWIRPTLAAVLVWENSASLRYIKQKRKWAEFVGIDFKLIQLKSNVTQIELEKTIDEVNNNNSIDGYIVQLPLPQHINETAIIAKIDAKKDVDGFHPQNTWKVLIWDQTWFVPCTPAGVMYMFEVMGTNLAWKLVTIVWRSNIVWKPLAALLINAWATVTVCNSKTINIKKHTSVSDIVIMATGQPHLLKVDMVKIGTTVIDVWFTVIDGKIYGDADFDIMEKIGNIITPVPGWVWALTVAMLMKNTLQAALLK
jgi:methylenetetrahydrofolate dehydrogenase (NADP+)/methenyltetrahydrofolate cyclohydrolase